MDVLTQRIDYELRKNLPHHPAVYLVLDQYGRSLHVGSCKNLYDAFHTHQKHILFARLAHTIAYKICRQDEFKNVRAQIQHTPRVNDDSKASAVLNGLRTSLREMSSHELCLLSAASGVSRIQIDNISTAKTKNPGYLTVMRLLSAIHDSK